MTQTQTHKEKNLHPSDKNTHIIFSMEGSLKWVCFSFSIYLAEEYGNCYALSKHSNTLFVCTLVHQFKILNTEDKHVYISGFLPCHKQPFPELFSGIVCLFTVSFNAGEILHSKLNEHFYACFAEARIPAPHPPGIMPMRPRQESGNRIIIGGCVGLNYLSFHKDAVSGEAETSGS